MPLGKPLLSVLHRMSCGGVILDSAGQVLDLNGAAKRILASMLSKGSDKDLSPEDTRAALKALLRSSNTRFTVDQDTWALVEREDTRQLLLYSIQLSDTHSEGAHTVVVLVDLEHWPQPNPATLQKVFGLTPAEAKLAVLIAQGEPLAEIAETCEISIATARTQLSHIFTKTRTHRQADLMALLARVALLP